MLHGGSEGPQCRIGHREAELLESLEKLRPEQLWSTTMDPKKHTLQRLS
jgi:hypothetical protein